MRKIFSLLIISASITSCNMIFSCTSWVEENIKPKYIYGIVVNKNEEKACHGKLLFNSMDNKIDSLAICICSPFQEKWNQVEIGDTIIKKAGEVSIEIINNSKKIKWERYPCCDW